MLGFRTNTLTNDELWGEIEAIASFFNEKGVREVAISYGLACNTSEIYMPIIIPVQEILSFVQRSICEGIYKLGKGELHIQGGDPPMLFVLCHAGDIHFESEEDSANKEIERRWGEKGISLHYYPV